MHLEYNVVQKMKEGLERDELLYNTKLKELGKARDPRSAP
jgi:hypothetical protein